MIISFETKSLSQTLENQSYSSISNINDGIDSFSYSCRDQIFTWLRVHSHFTWHLFLGYILRSTIVLFVIGRIIWLIHQSRLGNPTLSIVPIDQEVEISF